MESSAVTTTIIVAVLLIGGMFVTIAITEWRSSRQPVLSNSARVVAKRMDVSEDQKATAYYCTFEDEGGQQYEFRIPTDRYNQISEGDCGKLIYQGTRFFAFQG
jgi:Protein of unknown function (DUF2500)